MSRRILLLNVNTTPAVTDTLARAARRVAAPGTEILATQPDWGPVSVEGYYDGYVSAAACLDRLHALLGGADPELGPPWSAVVLGGFGEPGRPALQELLDVPVVAIAEAAAHLAGLLGRRYGVVTTLRRSCPQIEDALRAVGLYATCAAIVPTGVPVLGVDPDAVLGPLVEAGREAMAAGAEALCLGSGALAGLAPALARRLGVPVVDGTEAAVKLAEAACDLGLATSKVNAYADPLPKARPGWPRSGEQRRAGDKPRSHTKEG